MIDLRQLEYRVVAVTPEGEQLDITNVTTNLGWEEGERELSSRISLKLHNASYKGKMISELVQPNTPLFVYAISNGESQEVIRGTVQKWTPTESNGTFTIDIEADDEMFPLRHNQDDAYFSQGTSTKSAITATLDKWGVPYEYKGPDPGVAHEKMAFKKNWISDILIKILEDLKQKGGGVYFMRAKEGKVQILPRGSNETTYHFDGETNALQVKDSFDASGIVTQVKVVGKSDKEGHQAVEDVIKGKTEYGVRQEILERPSDKSLADIQKAAQELLKEKGSIKRKTSLSCADVPFLRKGDRIRVETGLMQGYWFVKSIRHNAADGKMDFDVDEDKEKNAEVAKEKGQSSEIDTVATDEYSGGEV